MYRAEIVELFWSSDFSLTKKRERAKLKLIQNIFDSEPEMNFALNLFLLNVPIRMKFLTYSKRGLCNLQEIVCLKI